MSKDVRLAARAGQQVPPFLWNVFVLDCVYGEAQKLLQPHQYAHVVDQIQELARTEDPTHPATVSVSKIEDYHELRDKGGVLGKINIRVFFGLDKDCEAIVVLGVIKKEKDGQTPQGDKIRMRRRWRKYRGGDFGKPEQPNET